MHTDPFRLSLETVIAASPLLGHDLEDRSRIRDAQDPRLLRTWRDRSAVRLRNASQQDLFCVAPLDILVSENRGEKQFHLIELNGTGIGGLTNLTADAVAPILDGLASMALTRWTPDALFLVASSGKESDDDPRLNRLIHEKLLFAEAIKRGLETGGGTASVAAMPRLGGQGLDASIRKHVVNAHVGTGDIRSNRSRSPYLRTRHGLPATRCSDPARTRPDRSRRHRKSPRE
jgi:hypothetical protein